MGKQRRKKKPRRREHRPIHDVIAEGRGREEQTRVRRGEAPASTPGAVDPGAGGVPDLALPGADSAVGAFRAFRPVDRLKGSAGTRPRASGEGPGASGRRARRGGRKPRGLLRRVIHRRRVVQGVVGVALYVLVARYNINLLWVILFGSLLGIVLGKVFCRWMCPMGFIMELIMGSGSQAQAQSNLYMYFKLGCPIAWLSGLLNKISLFRVKLNPDACSHCGVCEDACYISEFNETHGLHRPEAINASTHYSCSRCLACVSACPTGALSLGTLLPARAERTMKGERA